MSNQYGDFTISKKFLTVNVRDNSVGTGIDVYLLYMLVDIIPFVQVVSVSRKEMLFLDVS